MSIVSANLIQSLTSGDPTIKHAYGSDDLIADVDEWEKRNRAVTLAGLSWQGSWASGTAYAVNEAILATTNLVYRCLATHTSATSFADDLATGNWEQHKAPKNITQTYTLTATAVLSRTLNASATASSTNNNNVLAALITDLIAAGIIS